MDKTVAGSVQDLKERYYVLHAIKKEDEPEEREIVPFINISVCDQILSTKYYINVHYGTIQRGKEGNFVLSTRWAHRSVGNNSWWHGVTCPRQLRDEEGYSVTGCKGYVYAHVDTEEASPFDSIFIDDGENTILADILGE